MQVSRLAREADSLARRAVWRFWREARVAAGSSKEGEEELVIGVLAGVGVMDVDMDTGICLRGVLKGDLKGLESALEEEVPSRRRLGRGVEDIFSGGKSGSRFEIRLTFANFTQSSRLRQAIFSSFKILFNRFIY